jgi:hypothetical protein
VGATLFRHQPLRACGRRGVLFSDMLVSHWGEASVVVVPSTFVGTLGGSAGERSVLQPLLDAMGVRLTCSDATLYRQYHLSSSVFRGDTFKKQ